jgi:hypothetical protein
MSHWMKRGIGQILMGALACGMGAFLCGCELSSSGGAVTGVGEESGESGSESADETGDETGEWEAIEVAGEWESQFSAESITSESWDQGGFLTAVVSYDNGANWVVTQNPEDAEYEPGKYNKTIWTEPTADGFAYCVAAFGIATLEEAEEAATDTVDASDMDTGCGTFPWSILTPVASGLEE